MEMKTLEIADRLELDIRRPSGLVETVVHPTLKTITASNFQAIKDATAKAGRGEVLAFRCITKVVEDTIDSNPSRLAELQYIREHNAIMRASASGEKCDQIGSTFSDRTPHNKDDR
jgi:hypothetical protein